MKKNMTTITIRIEKEVKEEAMKLFYEMGMDMTTAINVFLRRVIESKSIPFELRAKGYNEETIKAVMDGINDENLIGPFESVEDMMKSVFNEEENRDYEKLLKRSETNEKKRKKSNKTK